MAALLDEARAARLQPDEDAYLATIQDVPSVIAMKVTGQHGQGKQQEIWLREMGILTFSSPLLLCTSHTFVHSLGMAKGLQKLNVGSSVLVFADGEHPVLMSFLLSSMLKCPCLARTLRMPVRVNVQMSEPLGDDFKGSICLAAPFEVKP